MHTSAPSGLDTLRFRAQSSGRVPGDPGHIQAFPSVCYIKAAEAEDVGLTNVLCDISRCGTGDLRRMGHRRRLAAQLEGDG